MFCMYYILGSKRPTADIALDNTQLFGAILCAGAGAAKRVSIKRKKVKNIIFDELVS